MMLSLLLISACVSSVNFTVGLYQIIMPYPEDRADHTLTDADQDNVYVITDVRKDASFHTGKYLLFLCVSYCYCVNLCNAWLCS